MIFWDENSPVKELLYKNVERDKKQGFVYFVRNTYKTCSCLLNVHPVYPRSAALFPDPR